MGFREYVGAGLLGILTAGCASTNSLDERNEQNSEPPQATREEVDYEKETLIFSNALGSGIEHDLVYGGLIVSNATKRYAVALEILGRPSTQNYKQVMFLRSRLALMDMYVPSTKISFHPNPEGDGLFVKGTRKLNVPQE